jgi:hypothetical protein
MASDDRDRTFEKALARHLRLTASSSLDASALAGSPAGPRAEFCPDPEILAAYHDGSLASEERSLWKQHVLSCDNCQLVLAHLATPLDIPVNLETEENVLVAQQRVSSARTASSAPIARPSPPHSLRWLWLVPAGAIAATLIAWVSLQERKPVQVAPSSPVEVAENRQSAAVTPPPSPAIPRERKEKDQAAAPSASGADSAIRDLASKQPQNEVQLTQQSPFQAAAKPTHGPYLSAQKQEQQIGRISAGSAGAFDQKKLDAQAAPNAMGGRIAGAPAQQIPVPALPPPPAPLPSSEPRFLDDGSLSANLKDKSPSAPAPTSSLAAPKTKAANADAISATSESVEVSAASRAPERAMLRAAALQNPHIFWAPGGKQAWRIGPAGSLELSKDKGLNWTPQISGVYTDLLAGYAPSAKVCWIVGSSGTVLRTTDGGTHWTKLDSPVTNDLTGIRATDATHAWIWFVPDLQTGLIKTFQTTDGGATWSPAPNQ